MPKFKVGDVIVIDIDKVGAYNYAINPYRYETVESAVAHAKEHVLKFPMCQTLPNKICSLDSYGYVARPVSQPDMVNYFDFDTTDYAASLVKPKRRIFA